MITRREVRHVKAGDVVGVPVDGDVHRGPVLVNEPGALHALTIYCQTCQAREDLLLAPGVLVTTERRAGRIVHNTHNTRVYADVKPNGGWAADCTDCAWRAFVPAAEARPTPDWPTANAMVTTLARLHTEGGQS
jgi:hypothetical protein